MIFDKDFHIYSLLHKNQEGVVSGPMSPVLFAKETLPQVGLIFSRLARVNFTDFEINQRYEGEGKTEQTGYDTLMVSSEYNNVTVISLFVDMGVHAIPIGMKYSDKPDMIVTQLYKDQPFEKSLSEEDIKAILDHAFANYDKVFEIPEQYSELRSNKVCKLSDLFKKKETAND